MRYAGWGSALSAQFKTPLAEEPTTSMRILLLQESEKYVRLLEARLAESSGNLVDLYNVPTLKEGIEKLTAGNIDLVLLELSLPDSQGLATFEQIQAEAPFVPVIILIGLEEELLALKALRMGAQDYILKQETDGRVLNRIFRNAIERQQAQTRLIDLSFKDELTGLSNRRGFLFLCCVYLF